jgi:hypothetical protein
LGHCPVSLTRRLRHGRKETKSRSRRTSAGSLRASVTNFPATQPVSGTVTANAGTGTFAVSGTVAATQSGTWTVQPGNTANTTAWKVDGSAVTQPVSIANGSDATQGTITDSQVVGDVDGTVSAKLRGINHMLWDTWNSASNYFRVGAEGKTNAGAAGIENPLLGGGIDGGGVKRAWFMDSTGAGELRAD